MYIQKLTIHVKYQIIAYLFRTINKKLHNNIINIKYRHLSISIIFVLKKYYPSISFILLLWICRGPDSSFTTSFWCCQVNSDCTIMSSDDSWQIWDYRRFLDLRHFSPYFGSIGVKTWLLLLVQATIFDDKTRQ